MINFVVCIFSFFNCTRYTDHHGGQTLGVSRWPSSVAPRMYVHGCLIILKNARCLDTRKLTRYVMYTEENKTIIIIIIIILVQYMLT